MEHTKEPWETRKGIAGFQDVAILADGGIIAETFERGGNAYDIITPAETNARRIVACVNACAGIPTDVLEKMPIKDLIASTRTVTQSEIEEMERGWERFPEKPAADAGTGS